MPERLKFYQDYHELVELMKKSDHTYNLELIEKAYLCMLISKGQLWGKERI